MTSDELYDLVLGASVVAIAYMLWKQHKAATPGNGGPAIDVPAPPAIQGNDQDGYWYDMDQLLSGAI